MQTIWRGLFASEAIFANIANVAIHFKAKIATDASKSTGRLEQEKATILLGHDKLLDFALKI